MFMKSSPGWRRLFTLLEIPAPDPPRLLRRIEIMERNIMLPVRAFTVGVIYYTFVSSPWGGPSVSTLDVTFETIRGIFWFYVLASGVLAALLLNLHRLPLAVGQWTAVTSSMLDGLFIGGLTLITGGMDSFLFWLFIALIIRNTVSVPVGFSQLILNIAICFCYVLVVTLDVAGSVELDEFTQRALDLIPRDDWGEPFALRLAVLVLTAVCCGGTQALWERQRLAVEEAEEFAAREGQLRSAGRLAAEFAHQIKNPLAVINSAAFSLQRALRPSQPEVSQQIEIIQEEVSRADRVITQIMGYAQLSEGHVEKLNVIEEIERAIAQVFPPAVPTGVRIHREYGHELPPLLVQRGHLSETFINLLKNAREALGERGNVYVTADTRQDQSIEVAVRDDGPGIGPDKIGRIFEAYYTTKERGTGLGLAIVKHNVELYGGAVQVESRLGNGATFTLIFPIKSLIKPTL
jgi:signal transduction histidine kinase